MSRFKVNPQTESALMARMVHLGIRETDLDEKFVLGSGKGGQKINKTSSCVYLLHRPSGFEVKCQQERSQSMNRFYARRELCDKIEERILGEKSRRQAAIEKIRRQKRRKTRKQKEKMLANKHARGEIKKTRQRVRPGGDE